MRVPAFWDTSALVPLCGTAQRLRCETDVIPQAPRGTFLPGGVGVLAIAQSPL